MKPELILFDLDGTLLDSTKTTGFNFRPSAVRGVLYDGVLETLNMLKASYQLGIVTNKSALGAERDLRHFGLFDLQSALVGGDSLEVCKPDPAPVLHACELAGVLPRKALFVGDGYGDYEAARAAGVRFVFCRYGYSKTLPPSALPFASIGQFSELLNVLEDLCQTS